ncbi:hypothetical protein JCM14469_12280 [Desulfatiferula olefinivorans]
MSDLSSRFIDNDLDLESKRVFVERIHGEDVFYRETLDFLDLEVRLRGDVVCDLPDPGFDEAVVVWPHWRLAGRVLSLGLACAAVLLMVVLFTLSGGQQAAYRENRFVIYRPDVSRVDIVGSFTGWEPIPLDAVGQSGYWEISLDIPDGVHRFTYLLDGEVPFADPTILTVERDDFGGINTILMTES